VIFMNFIRFKIEYPESIRDFFYTPKLQGIELFDKLILEKLFKVLRLCPNECISYSETQIEINLSCVREYSTKLVKDGKFINYLRLGKLIPFLVKILQARKIHKNFEVYDIEDVEIRYYRDTELYTFKHKNQSHEFENIVIQDVIVLNFDSVLFNTEREFTGDVEIYITYDYRYGHFVLLTVPITFEGLYSKESWEYFKGYIAMEHIEKIFNIDVNDLILYFDQNVFGEVKECKYKDEKEWKVKKIVKYLSDKYGIQFQFFEGKKINLDYPT